MTTRLKNFLVLMVLFFQVAFLYGQSYQFKLVDIYHGNSGNSERVPERVEVKPDSGSFLFSVRMNEDCPSYFNFRYNFANSMQSSTIGKGDTLWNDFNLKLTPLGQSCYPFQDENFRNPFVSLLPNQSVSYSGLIAQLKAEGKWSTVNEKSFFTTPTAYLYAYNYPAGVLTRSWEGKLSQFIPTDFEGNAYAWLQMRISGTSPLGGITDNFYYEIIFLFEVEELAKTDPCSIKPPDCSCCPGTIPVWNFKKGKGECICPEGSRWDKLQQRCINDY
jgi:hypothetical protein